MARGNTERLEVLRGAVLATGGVTRFDRQLPVGEGWTKMYLRFNNVVTIGTGTGALADGSLRPIRAITLRSDRGDFFVNAAPARFLSFLDKYKTQGAQAQNDAVAAASATYRSLVVIHFTDPLSLRPMDTVLDTARYNLLTLDIAYGGVADMFSTVGTSSVAPTMDVYIERVRGRLPNNVKPLLGVEYGTRAPLDPNSAQLIDLERAQNLSYKRLLAFASATTLQVGVPFSGDAVNTVVNDTTIDHDRARPFENVLGDMLRSLNQQDGAYETISTGQFIYDLVRDGSIQSALYSGDKSRLRVQWTNLGGLPNPAQVSLGYEAIRPLR